MNRLKRKWTSLTIALTMIITLLVPVTANAAGPRIDITTPLAATDVTSGMPADINAVPRFTNLPITITAGIQNITDAQITDIYYEITNIKSNPINNVVTVVKSNPAQHVPGSFNVTFNNVILTEGLNKIVVKMGGGSAVSSTPSWAFFTPTTNITNLTANGAPFLDTESYPSNPNINSTVTISGLATNATSVEVTIGNLAPKTVFLNNGTFFFTADNKPNSSATFHVNAGDNPITIVAKNSTKEYVVKRNLIYDDGNPFAYNATITTSASPEEALTVTGLQTNNFNITHLNVAPGSVEIWNGPGRTGSRITAFTVKSDPTNPGQSYVLFDSNISPVPTGTVYAYYSYGSSPLLSTPTTTTSNNGISSNLKVDLSPTGQLKYRFVDIIAGGTRFGPYDLTGATAATTAQNNGLFPSTINENYSPGYVIGIQGTGLNNTGSAISVTATDNSGAAVTTSNTGNTLTVAATPTNSTGTMAFFTLDAGAFAQIGSPYKVTVSNGTTILNNYNLVVKSAGALPQVTAISAISLKAGYLPSSESVQLAGTSTGGVNYSNTLMRIDITDITGKNVLQTATPSGISGTTDFAYTLPAGLQAGLYKIKVNYNGNELLQDLFRIGAADPAPPTFNIVATPLTVSIPAVPAFPLVGPPSSYFSVSGKNLGKLSDIDSNPGVAKLVDNGLTGASPVDLMPYYSNGSTIIFKILDTTKLLDSVVYDLDFALTVYNSAGTPTVANPVVPGVVRAKDLTMIPVPTASPFPYDSEVITDVWPGVVPPNPPPATPIPLQIDKANIATVPLTILGNQLLNKSKMTVQLLSITTGAAAGPGATVNSVDTTAHTASVTLPSSLVAGTYFVQITYYNGNILAQYPITIANPALANLSPPLIYSNLWSSGSTMVATGTGFGIDASKLDLSFLSDATGQTTTQKATSVEAESKAIFSLPNLPAGTYTVNLLFNGLPGGVSSKYTVAPPQPALQENALLSVPNRYKVFDFSTAVQIPTDRDQVAQFKFYNYVTDTLQPTVFSYHYVDPNLPYIQYTMVGNTQQLSELTSNTIAEMPTKLNIYANVNTKKVNLYIGTYNSSSKPYKSLLTAPDPLTLLNLVTFDLNSLPNGATKFTIIPSNDTDVTLPLLGENLSGQKVYDINITSTPYVIFNNVYTGMVVKDPISEITCTSPSNVLTPGCFSGRLVNMPPSSTWSTGTASLEMYVNGIKTNIVTGEVDPTLNTFEIPFNSAHGGPLNEGKNTISFFLYVAGVLQTKSSLDIFVFSTTAPEFQTIKPVEVTDIPKFIPGKTADAYSTSETAVSFKGQFLNANDLKLTVKTTDASGVQTTLYDRRIASNPTAPDPVTNNPGYLNTVDFTLPPLSFTTNPINLSAKGDTIFEFTIVNTSANSGSSVTITKTITITREPLPYVVVYPALTKNSAGNDQANINSNYVEIEMAAENADSVNFGAKTNAVKRQVTDQYGNLQTHFFYEISGLKAGLNTVKFTVTRGTQKNSGSFLLFNANSTIEGAQFKTALKPSLKVYNGDVQLSFPAGTNLMRNDKTALNQYLTSDRQILFGIANSTDGRVDKYKNPSADDGQLNNPNPLISPSGKLLLSEPTGRFRPASSMYWIDAGTIPAVVTDPQDALSGSGKLPYDPVDFFSRDIKDLVVPTKRGTLTLKYDSNIRSESSKYVTVYHYDIYEDYTGSIQYRWHNIGGVVDAAKNTITVPFDTFGYYQVMYMNQSFDDVTTHAWARNQLDTLYSKGIMVNKGNTDFVPNDNISRGEFAALLVKIFDIPLQFTETPTFADVLRVNPLTNGMYDYRYIETAANAGIVRGSGGGRFSPDEAITRQDAAVMISRAANLKLGTDVDKSLIALQKLFTDGNGIDVYARTSVEAVSKAGLIKGKENVLLQGQKKTTFRFDPAQTFTRAEAAQVAISVLIQQKKLK